MSIAEAVIEKLNTLPPEKQQQVLDFINSLAEKAATAKPYSFLDIALSLDIKGPPDLSEHLDDYLYGDKKHLL